MPSDLTAAYVIEHMGGAHSFESIGRWLVGMALDEASKLARAASPAFRLAYAAIAVEWLVLADEIARATMGSM